MSTTILTNEQIDETIESIGPDWWDVPPGADLLFARAIEQAVLQSPEIQARMEAYAAAKVREALELAAQTCENQGRATTTLDGESFYIALGQAARAVRALIPQQ